MTEYRPAIEPDADVFDVQRATIPEGRQGLFVLRLRGEITPWISDRLQAFWTRIWLRAGLAAAPELLIIDDTVTLEALGEAELASLGLMRVPAP